MRNTSSLARRQAPGSGLVRVHLGSGRVVYVHEACVRPWRLRTGPERVSAEVAGPLDPEADLVEERRAWTLLLASPLEGRRVLGPARPR